MQHERLTRAVIGSAYQVYNTLRYGFLETVYEKAMLIELGHKGLNVSSQAPINVHYGDVVVGQFAADLLVENQVIVELKSVANLIKAHETQLVNYLTATRKDVGLLINFSPQTVEVKRRLRTLPDATEDDK